MRLVLISDTHGLHRELDLPEGDVLIHAGDFTRSGTLSEVRDFNDWLGGLDFRHTLVVAGNHDAYMRRFGAKKKITNGVYLEDDQVEINGVSFWGHPWTPVFGSWFFMGDDQKLSLKTSEIPETDVLISHGPPYGLGDRNLEGEYVGCPFLRAACLGRIRPRLLVCGHIHEGYGSYRLSEDTEVINCSVVDRRYRLVNDPVVIDLEEAE